MTNCLFYILLCLCLLATGNSYSQSSFNNESEARTAMQQLEHTSANNEKIQLALHLANWYVLQETNKLSLQQAQQYASQALTLSNQLNNRDGIASAYLILSKLAQINHDYDKGKFYATASGKLSESLGEMNQAGEAYVMLWSNNALSGMSYTERIPLLTQAAECFHKGGNKCRESDCLREQGDLYHIIGEFGLALNTLKKSLQLSKEGQCKAPQGIYDLLGVCYLVLGDYSSAIQNGLLAIKTAESLGEDSTISLCTYYNRLGLSYIRANDEAKGRKCLDKSLAIAIKCKDPNSIWVLTRTNATLLIEDGNAKKALELVHKIILEYPEIQKQNEMDFACFMISTYQSLKLYDKAKPIVARVETLLHKDSSNFPYQAYAYNNLIPFFIETGNFNKAKFYADKFHAFSYKVKVPMLKSNYHMLQFRLDSARGNYVSAIKNYQIFNKLKDSLFDETKSMQINQLGILYEIEKKDRNIQVLSARSALQQSNLKQAALIRNINLGGSLLLLIILLLLFYSFRIKLKANRMLEQQQDVIKLKNDSLQHLVTEKEWLVKEIHHRVKNNLHMVVGLLASQTEFLKGEEAMAAITDSQHRVQAMSLIHQKLYQTEDLSTTDIKSYIFDLTEYLKNSFDQSMPVAIKLDIEKVTFSLSYSVPIGLIINEAVTNAIKYAFPNQKGTITISLHKADETHYCLMIRDNGIGLPQDFTLETCSSLGLTLIQGLSADLGGTLKMTSDHGTSIEILFIAEELRAVKQAL